MSWILGDERSLVSFKEGGKNSICKDIVFLKRVYMCLGNRRRFWGLWSSVYREELGVLGK